MKRDECAGKGQAEPGAAMAPLTLVLGEGLEDVRFDAFWNARALVRHAKHEFLPAVRFLAFDRKRDRPPVRGVIDGILQNVAQHLDDAFMVRVHRAEPGIGSHIQQQIVVFQALLDRVSGIKNNLVHRDIATFQVQLACVDRG